MQDILGREIHQGDFVFIADNKVWGPHDCYDFGIVYSQDKVFTRESIRTTRVITAREILLEQVDCKEKEELYNDLLIGYRDYLKESIIVKHNCTQLKPGMTYSDGRRDYLYIGYANFSLYRGDGSLKYSNSGDLVLSTRELLSYKLICQDNTISVYALGEALAKAREEYSSRGSSWRKKAPYIKAPNDLNVVKLLDVSYDITNFYRETPIYLSDRCKYYIKFEKLNRRFNDETS